MASDSANFVIDLTDETFDTFVDTHPTVAVGFTLPWVEHLHTRFVNQFTEAARLMHSTGIKFAIVDCAKEGKVSQQFNFTRWPSMSLFRGSHQETVYDGIYRPRDITSFIQKNRLPDISEVSAASILELRELINILIVGFMDKDDKTSLGKFETLTKSLSLDHNSLFAISGDHDLAKSEEIRVPGIVLYKGNNERILFQGAFENPEVASLVRHASLEIVPNFYPEVHREYIEAGTPLGYAFVNSDEDELHIRDLLQPLALKYKAIQMGIVDTRVFSSLLDDMQLAASPLPTFAIQDPSTNKKYMFDPNQELKSEQLELFIQRFLNGELQPLVRSEPIPETQQAPLLKVVGYNHDEILNDADKDVLIIYCTEWCGPCRAMAPMFAELANLYRSSSSKHLVTIAEIDGDKNDIPADVFGYPWIKLYPARAKSQPIQFVGPDTVAGMANFIKEHGSHKVHVAVGGE